MPDAQLQTKSLVLYKKRPALVTDTGRKKIEIQERDGRRLSVRHKDVALLHPGPLESLDRLGPRTGEIKTAWELLAGSTTTLPELAELAYGDYTPLTAWAAWQWVEDGLYFSGEPDEVTAHSREDVAAEHAAREAKAAEERAWINFLERVEAGTYQPEDERYLTDVELLAQDKQSHSQVLRALGRSETPENAHALLLELGYWDARINPYPARLGVPTESPTIQLPTLPEEERRNLTHLAAFAIDDEGNQDPDDAISWENGRLWVHVADAAALIPPDSAADQEARARGASLYLPEGTVTMLPQAVTARLGLGLDDVSPALTFGLDVNDDGEVSNVEIVPSCVRVTRLTYAEAEARLDESPLRELYRVARRYEARRQAQGAINIDLPEVKVEVDDEGTVTIRPLPALRSRDLVREAMLMTGEAVAHFAQENDVPIPYTVQDPPRERPVHPPETLSEMFAMRRNMTASQQQTTPGRHAGLGMPLYVQATSPLRRYLDLVVHQQLRAYLRGDEPLEAQSLMTRIGAAMAVAGDMRRAERRSIDHWTLVYLLQYPDWQGEGIIVDKRGSADLVLIPELAWETRLYLSQDLPLDTHVTLSLGDVNLPELTAYFHFEG